LNIFVLLTAYWVCFIVHTRSTMSLYSCAIH